MSDLPLAVALSSVLAAAVDGASDRNALLLAARAAHAGPRLAPVVPLRRPARPGEPGPDHPRAA